MAKFTDLAEQQNAVEFKTLFEQTIADKISDMLDAYKIIVAEKMSAALNKHVKYNPYKHNRSPLQQDERGFIGMDSISASERGGLSNVQKEELKVGEEDDEKGGMTAAKLKVHYMPKPTKIKG
jgi:hypothetical protein